MCVSVCVCVFRVALGKKRLLESQVVLGNFQQPLNVQVLHWYWNCPAKGFDVGVRAILAPTLMCAPPVTLGGRLAAAPLALKQHGALWSGTTPAWVAGTFSIQTSPGCVLWLTAVPRL